MGGAMKVLVCGDRNWQASGMVYSSLDTLRESFPDLEVISGYSTGADSHGANWAMRNNVKLHAFYADWKKYGKAAGPIRNQRMLTEGQPDLVLAFHDDLSRSKGTAHMVKIAQAAGVETLLVAHPKQAEGLTRNPLPLSTETERGK